MNSSDRIYREVVASLLSSKLKPAELKRLADLLSRDVKFVSRVASAIRGLSSTLDDQEELFSAEQLQETSSFGPLVDHAYAAAKRRRLSKGEMLAKFRTVAPEIRWTSILRDMPLRDMFSAFFERASTEQTYLLLGELGMDVPQDPYLGFISSRGYR